MRKIFKKRVKTLLKTVGVLLLAAGLLLTSWPAALNLPPNIREVRAASPTVQSRGTNTANAQTITVTLSGTPADGNLYIVFLQSQTNAVTWTQATGTTGWTELYDSNGQSVWYKQIGASEPDPVFEQSQSTRSGYSVMQITGHEDPATQAPEAGTQSTGTDSSPDPPSITPTGGSKDYLFIAVAGANSAQRTFTNPPTNYVNLNSFNTGGGPNGGAGASAERQLTASTEDPGTFTMDGSATWYANTIAVHPAAATTTLTQNDFEFFVDNDALTPSEVWGNPDIPENTALNAVPPSNDPIDPGDNIRIRMNISVTDAQLDASTEGFILQYAEASDCTTVSSWTDVDAIGGAGTWRFFDAASVTDGTALDGASLLISTSEEEGRYSESDPTSTNPVAVPAGQELEWDWNVEYNSSNTAGAKTFCFRMIKDDPAALDAYNADSYPRIDTRPATADLMRHGNFFTTGIERGFFWAD